MTSLDDWVGQRYARPVVLLESSTAADAICARHGLDAIQLLRPHCVYTGGPLSARTGDRSDPVMCSTFGVRLMRTDCVRDVALSQITRHVRRLMRASAAMDMAYGEQLDRAVESIVEGGRSRHDGSLPHPVRSAPPPPPPSSSSVSSSAAAVAVAGNGSTGGPSPPSTLLERASPSWHRAFVRDFHALVRCSSFDTIDHPVGVLFAVATSEAGGVEGILQVFRAQAKRVAELKASLPGMDTELHQYYLILHDNTAATSPSLTTARQVLTAVQQLYGANYCALIKVNSVLAPRSVKSLDPSLWVDASPAVMDVPSAQAIQRATVSMGDRSVSGGTAAIPSASSSVASTDMAAATTRNAVLSFRTVSPTCGTWPNSHTAMLTGCYMSPEDVTEVHNVMAYYLSQSLFKFIERRLRMLDVSVQDRRTTTLGKMAAWFKGKDEVRPRTADVIYPPHGSDPSVLPKYVATSLEMQMRHCGDLSLTLHDYEGAINYYRLCIEELLETLTQRPYNRAMIAACQEGIGVAQFLQRRAAPPSLTPWYTGITSSTHRISSQTNRWEVAWNDYLAAGTQTYAVRIAFLLYEFSRTRLPPMLDRSRAILLHLQRSGVLQRQNLLNGVVNDMLASLAVFSNAPFAAGLAMPPAIPRDYPMFISLRRFARYLQQAGAFYRADNSLDQALRCYLRVLELFRVIDPQETWKDLAEHLYVTVGQLYTQLGQEVRGIAMASAAVAQGTPMYRHPDTAHPAFTAFWAQQKHVLGNMGYALCPHMPMPRIVRASFHVDRNYYGTDATTDEVARRMGEATAAAEWRVMEKQLQKTYSETVLPSHPQYRFPQPHNGHTNGNGKSGGDGRSGDGRRSGNGGGGGGGGGASSPSSAAHAKTYDYIFADAGDAPRAPRHYTIARAEPLVLSFVMENPVGCAVEATDLTLLYLSYTAPDQLWKSSTTQSVKLAAGARQRVSLSFDPVAEGEYAIIGLCWSLLGQEGYYYFATRESRPGCPESLYEYAIEHPMPTLAAVENIHVTVMPSKACVTATFRPQLPDHLYDGEYYHTKLVVHNTSTQQDATHVLLQRSPTAAHLLYIEEFGLAKNLDFEAPLVLAEHLKAQEARTFAVTIRGQHRRGDVSLQSSGNYVFMLLAYLPGTPRDHERRVREQTPTGLIDAGGASTHTTPAQETLPASGVVSPMQSGDAPMVGSSLSGGKGTLTSSSHASSSSTPPPMVRLHRLLRRCDVQPVLAMYSTVLPPANASLKAAVVLTVKNICTPHIRTRAFVSSASAAGASVVLSPAVSNDAVRALPAAASDGVSTAATETANAYAPLRVARVLAVHSSRWGIECTGTDALVADRAMQCLLSQGDCLSLALLVKRQPRVVGTADTTARHLFLNRAAAPSLGSGSDFNGAPSPYADTTCLALTEALPSPSRIKAVEGHLGTTVSQSERNLFFLQTSCLGPGHVGVRTSSDDGSGGLAFYADKAGQQRAPPKSAEQRRRDEVAEERRLCGAAMEQYTPLALAVTWVREGHDGLRKGQLFLFVDPIEHIYQTLAQQQKRQADQETAAAQLRPAAALAASSPANSSSAASVEQTQQELCEAMLVRYASLKPWQGAVVSHVHVPPVVQLHHDSAATSSGLSSLSPTAVVPVTLRCLSLAPVPLLVTAEALPPSAPSPLASGALSMGSLAGGSPITGLNVDSQRQFTSTCSPRSPTPQTGVVQRCSSSSGGEVPVLFVGKTVHTFLLMPSEDFEVKFTAHALRPGVVDCQRITLRAVSMCFVHGTVEAEDGSGEGEWEKKSVGNASMSSLMRPLMRTGMTLPTLVRALLERRAPSFTSSMTTRVVLSAQNLFESSNRNSDGAGLGANGSEALTGNNPSNLDHWKALAGSPRGRAEAGVANTATMMVERYGARAAEVLHQLSPRGPAASATASQVIPLSTPAFTRVVINEAPSHASASAAVTPSSASFLPSHPPPTHEMARKFFRQLDAFEAEVQRAAQISSTSGGPVDARLHQYVYRPTVKSMDNGSTATLSANNSLAMTRANASALMNASTTSTRSSTTAATAVAAIARTSSPQLSNTSPVHQAVREKDGLVSAAAPATTELPSLSLPTAVAHSSHTGEPREHPQSVFGAAPELHGVADDAAGSVNAPIKTHSLLQANGWESEHSSHLRHRSLTQSGSLAIAIAGDDGNGADEAAAAADVLDVGEDMSSPLHLPAVAFERRAAEAAETLDIGERSGSEGLMQMRPQRSDEHVLGEGMHMHDNSYYGVEDGGADSCDSELATNTTTTTLTDIENGTPLPPPAPRSHDFSDTEESVQRRRHLSAPKTKATTMLVPSSVPVSHSAQAPPNATCVNDASALPPPIRAAQEAVTPQFDSTSSSSSLSSTSSPSSSLTSQRSVTPPAHEPQHPLA